MIKLVDVSKYYSGERTVTQALNKINLEMEIGEFIAITGESGSGKSTLLNVISGIDTYEDGELYIDGEETSYFDQKDWENYRCEKIAFIFQNYNLIDSYSVLKNVEAALVIQGISKKERTKRAKDIIDKVGLTSHLHHKAAKLSGGQKQRVAIARALAKDTKIIVADEPTGNLDKQSSEQILSLLNEIAKDKLVLIVTHNYELAEQYVSRKIRLYNGKIAEDRQIKNHNKVNIVNISQAEKLTDIKKSTTLGSYNLLFQPKKTIFMFLVSIATVFFVFLIYVGAISSANNINRHNSNINSYPERIIVVRKDENILSDIDNKFFMDSNYFESIIKEDSVLDYYFYFNTFQFSDGGEDIEIDLKRHIDFHGSFNPTIINNQNRLIGRLPSPKEDGPKEILLSMYLDMYEQEDLEWLLNKEVNMEILSRFSSNLYDKFVIVGFVHDPSYNSNFYVTPDTLAKIYETNRGIDQELDVTFYQNDHLQTMTFYNFLVHPDLTGNELWYSSNFFFYDDYSPYELKIKDYSFVIKPVSNYSSGKHKTIFISKEMIDKLFPIAHYQYTLNLKNASDYKSALDYLYNNGYYGYSPYNENINEYESFYNILNTVLIIFKYIGIIFVIFIVYLFSFLIFRTILKSKIKDYTVFRIFGANQKVIRNMIVFELIVSFTFAYGLFMVFVTIFKDKIIYNMEFSLIDYLAVFIINIFLSLLIAYRFIKQQNKHSLFANLRIE